MISWKKEGANNGKLQHYKKNFVLELGCMLSYVFLVNPLEWDLNLSTWFIGNLITSIHWQFLDLLKYDEQYLSMEDPSPEGNYEEDQKWKDKGMAFHRTQAFFFFLATSLSIFLGLTQNHLFFSYQRRQDFDIIFEMEHYRWVKRTFRFKAYHRGAFNSHNDGCKRSWFLAVALVVFIDKYLSF